MVGKLRSRTARSHRRRNWSGWPDPAADTPDATPGPDRAKYGLTPLSHPTRSAITVAGIVGNACNNSRIRGSNASTADPADRRTYCGGPSEANAARTVLRETPRAIILIGIPSARCNRRISAQSSTDNTPSTSQLTRARSKLTGGQNSTGDTGSFFTRRRRQVLVRPPQVWKQQRLARYPDQKQRRLWLGTKWESRVLTAARYGSSLLTCARGPPAETRKCPGGGDVDAFLGSRGRRFKSGRPDQFFRTPYGPTGNETRHDRSHLAPAGQARRIQGEARPDANGSTSTPKITCARSTSATAGSAHKRWAHQHEQPSLTLPVQHLGGAA